MKPARLRALALVAFLAGCANHPGDCALGIMDWDDCFPGTAGYRKHQASLARDEERCASYGLTPGTLDYAMCREGRDAARVGRSQAVLGALLGQAVRTPAMVVSGPASRPTVPIGIGAASAGCESGHWVKSVASGGSVVVLENGSAWSVGPLDKIKTALWLPVTNVLACEDKLVSLDTGEVAQAQRIR